MCVSKHLCYNKHFCWLDRFRNGMKSNEMDMWVFLFDFAVVHGIGYYYYHTSDFNSRVKMANGSILFFPKTKSNYTTHSSGQCKHIVRNFSFDFKSSQSFLFLSYYVYKIHGRTLFTFWPQSEYGLRVLLSFRIEIHKLNIKIFPIRFEFEIELRALYEMEIHKNIIFGVRFACWPIR